MKKKFRLLALLLALTMALGILTGCTENEINSTIDAVSELVEILDEPTAPEAPAPTAQVEAETKAEEPEPSVPDVLEIPLFVDEDESYDSKEEVALYIHTYGHLPPNYVSKTKASKAGWNGGSLEKYMPGKSIGGGTFANREGLLPAAEGRSYKECDIDTLGKSARGAKRIVFSNDGLIYYTDDHYESFELLYGEP